MSCKTGVDVFSPRHRLVVAAWEIKTLLQPMIDYVKYHGSNTSF